MNTRTRARELRDTLIDGCGDHGCRFRKPSGRGTNGGCRCMDRIQDALDEYAHPGFKSFVAMLDEFLTHYPPGSIVCSDLPNADAGARFTAGLRKAREILGEVA